MTLDVEMPGIGGLETLKAIQRMNAGKAPGMEVGVVMVGAYTKRGADITVQALQAGTFDFVTKPGGPQPEENVNILRQQLLGKIRLFMRRTQSETGGPGTGSRATRNTPSKSALPAAGSLPAPAATPGGSGDRDCRLHGRSPRPWKRAPDLVRRVDLPILVVQHMPPKFTQSLAENLARLSG